MKKAIILDTLKKYRYLPIMLGVMALLHLLIFYLYNLNLEPFFYGVIFMVVILIAFYLVNVVIEYKRAENRYRKKSVIGSEWVDAPRSLEESDYREIIDDIERQMFGLERKLEDDRTDMKDYYTTWVHQIKTPIAVMRMRLADEDTELGRALSAELFRVEQYVEMVLAYIRLDSKVNDLVIQEYELDELLRKTIRKFANQFVGRKIRMNFEPTGYKFSTDQKWFCGMIEQLLSNAVKYTSQGGDVSIYMNDRQELVISDTGIGIASEDLPMIFEKGYTGKNGRGEQKSSGLGLYLCKKTADLLSIPIRAESLPGKGTIFILPLRQE